MPGPVQLACLLAACGGEAAELTLPPLERSTTPELTALLGPLPTAVPGFPALLVMSAEKPGYQVLSWLLVKLTVSKLQRRYS